MAGDMECWGSWKTSRTEAGSDYKSGLGLPRQLPITRGASECKSSTRWQVQPLNTGAASDSSVALGYKRVFPKQK